MDPDGRPRDDVGGSRRDSTVEDVSLLAEFGDEYLYRMNWIDRVQPVVDMITNARATVLEAHGTDGNWALRVMYPARDDTSETREFCADHGLTFDIREIERMDERPAGRFGLTDEQHEARRTNYNLSNPLTVKSVNAEEGIEETKNVIDTVAEQRSLGVLVFHDGYTCKEFAEIAEYVAANNDRTDVISGSDLSEHVQSSR